MRRKNKSYKRVTDDRKPTLIKHSKICYSKAIKQKLIDEVDTSYPGILIKYDTGYLLEDGCHRIAKLQQEGVYESLFYVVTVDEYKSGLVEMVCGSNCVILGEWNHNKLTPQKHQ
jgi:hypothetical protein